MERWKFSLAGGGRTNRRRGNVVTVRVSHFVVFPLLLCRSYMTDERKRSSRQRRDAPPKDHLSSWHLSADTAANARRRKVIGRRIYDARGAITSDLVGTTFSRNAAKPAAASLYLWQFLERPNCPHRLGTVALLPENRPYRLSWRLDRRSTSARRRAALA